MRFYKVEYLTDGFVVIVEWHRDRGLANTSRVRHDETGERDPRTPTTKRPRHYTSTLRIVDIACTETGILAALNGYAGATDTSG